jgi:hypothetical protein
MLFLLVWNSIKNIVLSLAVTKSYELPFTINKNNIKCLDYDMDNVVFQTINYKKNNSNDIPIPKSVEGDILVYTF